MLHFSNIYIKRKEVKLGSFCLKCNLQGEGSRNLTITTDTVWSALKSERLEGKVDGGARFQIPQRGTKKREAGRKECKWKRGKQLKERMKKMHRKVAGQKLTEKSRIIMT